MSFAKVQSSARNCKAHHIFLVAISMHSDPLSPSHNSAILKAARVFISTGVMGVIEHSADSRLFLFLYRCQAWVGGVFQSCSGTKIRFPHQRSEIVPFLTIYSSVSSLRVPKFNLFIVINQILLLAYCDDVLHHWNDIWKKYSKVKRSTHWDVSIVVYITGRVSSFLNMYMSDVYVSALCWCGELLPKTKTSVYATPHVLITLCWCEMDSDNVWKTCLTQSTTEKKMYIILWQYGSDFYLVFWQNYIGFRGWFSFFQTFSVKWCIIVKCNVCSHQQQESLK